MIYTYGVWNTAIKYQESTELKLFQRDQEIAQTIGNHLEDQLKHIKITNQVIKEKVIHEVTKEPIYTECVNTPDGVRLIEQAINATSE